MCYIDRRYLYSPTEKPRTHKHEYTHIHKNEKALYAAVIAPLRDGLITASPTNHSRHTAPVEYDGVIDLIHNSK